MNFGFPSANNSFENHNVSEESFWPSFTDIMMVIVMIFLLVAISVILNNYHLVENLKKSMQAQQLASSIAEDAQVENSSLEERLLQLKQQLIAVRAQVVDVKEEATNYQLELQKKQQIIKELNAISVQKDKQLDEKTTFLAQLEEQSKQQLNEKNAEISKLNLLQQTQAKELAVAQKKIASRQQQDKQINTLKEKLKQQTREFNALKQQRQTDEAQLVSLQGELESLDKKYQKLLRPARSAKGKYVVAVVYTKHKGREQYRLRLNPAGEYKNVSRKQLERELARMKNKHGTNLYVKVIIPENSGLSYNAAWKFTSTMQKSYDYYFQEEGVENTAKE